MQRTAQKRGQALGFAPGRAARPGGRLDERLDHDFDAAAFDFVAPDAMKAGGL